MKKIYFAFAVLSLLLISINLNSAAQIPINGLIGCYPFNGNANDGSGNNYHGTVYGAIITTDRFGRANNAYSFNGTTNYISLPFTPFNLPSFSYSVWAYVTSYPSNGNVGIVISIGSYGGGASISLANAYGACTGWSCGCYSALGQGQGWWTGNLPPLNTWFHLVMTKDASYIKYYINRQVVYSEAALGPNTYYGSGPFNANIGRRDQMSLNQFFQGKIDDIHIYNRALTAGEVTLLYNGGTNAVSITASPGTTICAGNNVTFISVINGNIPNPTYLWQINDSIVEVNSSIYSTTSLKNGDIVKCIVFPSQACEVPFYSNSLAMTVIPIPSTPTITHNFSVLTSSSVTGNQWYLNTNIIPGATNQSYTYTVNGSYTVIVTLFGCPSMPSMPFVINDAGIEELSDNYGFSIFPNPNDGKFTITFNSNVKYTFKIEITNELGQKVYVETINNFKGTYLKQMNLSDYGKGVYTICLTNAKNETFKKIVVY